MCHHGWIRSCIFSREEGTVMCVTTDKDGLGVVFSPGKSELSCVSPWTKMDYSCISPGKRELSCVSPRTRMD